MKKKLNVLFTSVGRRVELLKAFRAAYHALGLAGRIAATDVDPLAAALQLADCPTIVPPLTSSDYISALVELCSKEEIGLVFPLIDPDIRILARHRVQIEATGAKLAVVPLEAAEICDDKWKTAEFFRSLGLPVPRAWLPDQIDPRTATYPLFIKPRCGSASNHTFRVGNAAELEFFKQYVPKPIIEELLPGPEFTNDVICDLGGELLAVISRRRIEVRWGEVAKGVTVYDPVIADACQKIAQALPAAGPITVQCMLKDGLPHFTEINARLGGGVPLGIAAGADAPRWLLARAAGIDVEIPPLGEPAYRTGVYMTRFDDSFFLSETQREQLASSRI